MVSPVEGLFHGRDIGVPSVKSVRVQDCPALPPKLPVTLTVLFKSE